MNLTPLTRDQAAVVGAFTGIMCGPFQDMHEYAERLFGRPIQVMEMGQKSFEAELREKSRADFLAICCPKDAAS